MKKRRYKRKPFKPIDREQFREIRLMHRYSIEDTAKLLHVSPRTVAHWESGANRIPYSAFKLLRLLIGHELPDVAWQGWRVIGDTLYAPTGRGFKPYELTYLANYLSMARYWQADYAKRSLQRQAMNAVDRFAYNNSDLANDSPGYIGLHLVKAEKP